MQESTSNSEGEVSGELTKTFVTLRRTHSGAYRINQISLLYSCI